MLSFLFEMLSCKRACRHCCRLPRWPCRGNPDGVLDDAIGISKLQRAKSNNEWIGGNIVTSD